MRAPSAASPPTKSTTSFGNTGMMMPIASMSSTMVTNMKANAARRGVIPFFIPNRSPSLPLPLPRIRVRLLPQRQPDRHARQIEAFPQRVDKVAAVAVRYCVGAGAEQHEAWRAGLRLGDVVELEAAARHRGRRIRGQYLVEPAVERIGGD